MPRFTLSIINEFGNFILGNDELASKLFIYCDKLCPEHLKNNIVIDYLKSLPNLKIIKEKDYIKNVKPNGYRSYHLIVEITAPYEDILGNNPGKFFAEIQVRTIAMDSWASLEHQMKYKHDIKNPELIVKELKRCADELAACDVSMQTIRNLINAEN